MINQFNQFYHSTIPHSTIHIFQLPIPIKVLVIAQCFSLMPVCGIYAATAQGLRFSWRSWRTWYSVLCICSLSVDTIFTINMTAHSLLDVRNVEPIIFHVCNLLGFCVFLQLARKWPTLMRHWAAVEQQLPPHQNWKQREHLARRIHQVAMLLLSLSLMEHLLSIIAFVYHDLCPSRRDPIDSYLFATGPQLFHLFAYSNWLGWLGKLQNVLLTFSWSYMDIFLMLLGIGLNDLLTRLTCHLQHAVQQPMPEEFWTHTRKRYRAIVELIYEVDDAVSVLIIVSFGSNLYFVCLQLLKSINTMQSTVHAFYFYFSLSFLIGRSTAVLLFVSSVNDAARDPLLQLLRQVPHAGYSDEVSRLASELSADNVSLSGLKFFSITRKLFLSVAGSIVTYELVLIQFHEDKKSWDCHTQQPLN
ncbi:gustatory receptor 5a for trehalose isoform X1 [Drosophila sulfurigaster albostrigata]|uniref:gustatory receptor 5a for trehalose isoform X1 n=2 Tax=Drosophila sulfurigaster albostrigata TaxID=89887 RepID=UPI002D21AF90|nr:gustatory receptor 5a for trehalose isoform X1 [Drosophila sulfurigaster albostrigata]